MFVQRSSSTSDAHAYFQACLDAVAKQEDMEQIASRQGTLEKYRIAGLLPQSSEGSESRLHDFDESRKATHPAYLKPREPVFIPTQSPKTVNSKKENLKAAFYSYAGRRYANNYRRFNSKRADGRNPISKDGKVMLCRVCGSDRHFVRDFDVQNKAKFVAFVTSEIGNEALDFPVDDILDTVQDIPNEVWEVHYTTAETPESAQSVEDFNEPKRSIVHSTVGQLCYTRVDWISTVQ